MPTLDRNGMYATSIERSFTTKSQLYAPGCDTLYSTADIITRRIDVVVAVLMLEMYGRPVALVLRVDQHPTYFSQTMHCLRFRE